MTGMGDLYNILLDFQAILVRLVEAILSYHLHAPGITSPIAHARKLFQIKRAARLLMALGNEYSQNLGSFLWTPEQAEIKEITQIGTSACGATAVLNILVCAGPALKFLVQLVQPVAASVATPRFFNLY